MSANRLKNYAYKSNSNSVTNYTVFLQCKTQTPLFSIKFVAGCLK